MDSLRQVGYSIRDACNALGVSRSRYYARRKPKVKKARSEGTDGVVERIKRIKA